MQQDVGVQNKSFFHVSPQRAVTADTYSIEFVHGLRKYFLVYVCQKSPLIAITIYMKYLCIHGHFYQPPRENAWLETIDRQDSAAPYHDWNARIAAECYEPNALARVLNDKDELIRLIDNYAHISFNFGPTLLSWMQENTPEIYQSILEADKKSQQNFGGHGSAIAQVYNHIILPLANARDKQTQVRWGLYDFKTRFGRDPEAMWLSETACNTETLEVLAAHGMKYVILAPGQCARIRKIGEKEWHDTSGAKVDPKRAYQCNLPSGKKIALFFYDGPVSQGIAFSDTLKSGQNFAQRLLSTYATGDETQLVNIATDGETYGHHQKFADMALASCLQHIESLSDVQLTVYGEFLEKYPPKYEAQIFENTSWSCFHGVERWRSNCGCNSGRQGWHQKWRAPLRAALDFVRDTLIETFENKGREYFKDPWAARDDYIELILDRSLDAQHKFFLRHATEKAWRDRSGALMLLEMQRHCLLMYTSCGWFFDEISGIETVQILQYAARALELNRLVGGRDVETELVHMLEMAPSNIKEVKNGAGAYERYVKPSQVSLEKIAAQIALQQAFSQEEHVAQTYCCELSHYTELRVESDTVGVYVGSMHLKNRITLEEADLPFAVGYTRHTFQMTCGIGYKSASGEKVCNTLKRLAQTGAADKLHAEIERSFSHIYPFSSLFADVRYQVLNGLLARMEQTTADDFARIFERQYPAVRGLKYIGASLPAAFTAVAEFVLTDDVRTELEQPEVDINSLEELMEDVRSLGLTLDLRKIMPVIQDRLLFYAQTFKENPQELQVAVKLVEFINYMEIFGFAPDYTRTQLLIFQGLDKLPVEKRGKSILKALARKLKIAL